MATKKEVKDTDTKVEDVDVKEEKITTKKKELKPPNRDEMITCRSVVIGGLTYVSERSGATWRFDDYGAEQYIEYGELLSMKASKPVFLFKPWLVIDDNPAAIKYLGLESLYNSIVPIENLEEFFRQPLDKISEKLEKLPLGARNILASKARKMIENRELYDIRIIDLLEEKLQLDLSVVE
ncbi:hypothetical protein CF086_16800 [Clostridium botulinum]|uniref:hypothetical protein n=1 Tax=Clostridium botulinum TaxID=1491 RepID=UPI0007733984|nr:hypothetical protein [Clostridium botulinum]MBN3351954.1 hypothetical protein [Clostridium botulinum]